VCITIDDLDDDINSQGFIKSLSRLLSVVDVAEQCSLKGGVCDFRQQLATETATAPHSWSGFQKISESELHLVQYGH